MLVSQSFDIQCEYYSALLDGFKIFVDDYVGITYGETEILLRISHLSFCVRVCLKCCSKCTEFLFEKRGLQPILAIKSKECLYRCTNYLMRDSMPYHTCIHIFIRNKMVLLYVVL